MGNTLALLALTYRNIQCYYFGGYLMQEHMIFFAKIHMTLTNVLDAQRLDDKEES